MRDGLDPLRMVVQSESCALSTDGDAVRSD